MDVRISQNVGTQIKRLEDKAIISAIFYTIIGAGVKYYTSTAPYAFMAWTGRALFYLL
jgi:hypothetical protein